MLEMFKHNYIISILVQPATNSVQMHSKYFTGRKRKENVLLTEGTEHTMFNGE